MSPKTLHIKQKSIIISHLCKKENKQTEKTHIYQQHCDKNFSLSFNLLNVCVWVAGVVDRYHHRHFDITPHYTFKIRCFLQLETINTLKAAVLKLFMAHFRNWKPTSLISLLCHLFTVAEVCDKVWFYLNKKITEKHQQTLSPGSTHYPPASHSSRPTSMVLLVGHFPDKKELCILISLFIFFSMLLLFAVIIAVFGLDVMFNVLCFYIKLLDVRIGCIHIINFYAAFHGIQDTRLSWLLASWLISEVMLLCYYYIRTAISYLQTIN